MEVMIEAKNTVASFKQISLREVGLLRLKPICQRSEF
jgi:hypothetical protein